MQIRILVVDDEKETGDYLQLLLTKAGYEVIALTDPTQVMDRLRAEDFHLVILDMMMPRMGGYPVLEHFKDKPDAPPIIMITANEGSRHKAYAEYLGVIDYIRKPFAMDDLLEAVDRGLSGQPPASGA